MDDLRLPKSVAKQLALCNRISEWFKNAGIDDRDVRATLAVGLADSLDAARAAADDLEKMLSEDPRTPEGADRALTHAANMYVWLFNELKFHLLEIEPLWEPELETRLAERAPDEVEEDG